MVLLNARSLEIVRMLIGADKPLTIRTLAQKLQVSPRTIRNDLDSIDYWLGKNGQTIITRKPKVGISLEADIDKVSGLIQKSIPISLIRSPLERVQSIVGMLLWTNKEVRRKDLAEKFQVSDGTISSDINMVKEWMNSKGINLALDSKIGLYVDESENKIRQGYYVLLQDILSLDKNKNYFIKTRFANVANIFLQYYLDDFSAVLDKWREDILHCIEDMCTENQINMSDDGFCSMFIFLLIGLTRFNAGFTVKLSAEEKHFVISRAAEIDCSHMYNFIEERTGLGLNEDEEIFSAAQWMSQAKYGKHLQEVSIEDIKISKEIIDAVQDNLGIRFTVDENTKISMAAHINALFYRTLMNITGEKNDEIVADIKTSFDDIFAVVRNKMIEVLERTLKRSNIADSEVAYITMYIMVSIYKGLMKNNKKLRVVIVCGSTIATSQVLQSRLAMVFSNINVVKTLPYNEFVTSSEKDLNCDLIISTVPIEKSVCPSIMVNPLLKPADITKLTKYFMLQTTHNIDLRQYLGATINIASKTLSLTSKQEIKLLLELTKNITHEVKKMSYVNIPSLKCLLTPAVIDVDVKVANSKEAINYAGGMLMRQTLLKQRHINKIIRLNRELGGYMVIDKGVALPHLLIPEIEGPCVSLITLAAPVNFGNELHDPVDVVILLLSNNKTVHIRVIEDIINLLNDQERMARLRQAQSPSEVMDIIT